MQSTKQNYDASVRGRFTWNILHWNKNDKKTVKQPMETTFLYKNAHQQSVGWGLVCCSGRLQITSFQTTNFWGLKRSTIQVINHLTERGVSINQLRLDNGPK